VSPIIEANEQFESVQVVDRDQLYDPAHYISPSNRNGVDMNGNGVQGMVICRSTINRSIKKINVFIGPGDSAITDAGNTYGSLAGNIESVPVMPSPEPSNTNVDLSESIGKATISSSRKWHSV
jgi:hypothetical protein